MLNRSTLQPFTSSDCILHSPHHQLLCTTRNASFSRLHRGICASEKSNQHHEEEIKKYLITQAYSTKLGFMTWSRAETWYLDENSRCVVGSIRWAWLFGTKTAPQSSSGGLIGDRGSPCPVGAGHGWGSTRPVTAFPTQVFDGRSCTHPRSPCYPHNPGGTPGRILV